MSEIVERSSGSDGESLRTQPPASARHKLSPERHSVTHKFSVAGHEGYIIVGLYDDGTPGELFLKVNKQGSTLAGLMDTIAIAVSAGLQHGVPLSFFVTKFSHSVFEPSGWTGNTQIGYAKSLVDYILMHPRLKMKLHKGTVS